MGKLNTKWVATIMVAGFWVFLATACGTSTNKSASNTNSTVLLSTQQNNGNLVVSVNVKNISDLYGAAVTLSYDPTVLKYQNAEAGGLLNANNAQTNFLAAEEAGANGVVVLGYSRQGIENGVGGSGTIANVDFSVLNKAGSLVTITSIVLKDSKGNIINTGSVNPSINVGN